MHATPPTTSHLKGYGTIWARGLVENGFGVIGSDLSGQDFLEWEPPLEYHCIVTNPPSFLKDQFLKWAFALRMPFAFLVPYTILEGVFRQAIFREHRIELVLFDRRINFETPNQKANGRAWFPTMWLTYRLKIGQQLTFARRIPGENRPNTLHLWRHVPRSHQIRREADQKSLPRFPPI